MKNQECAGETMENLVPMGIKTEKRDIVIELDIEDLLREIRGMIKAVNMVFESYGSLGKQDCQDMYFTTKILGEKYHELLIRLNYVEKDSWFGM